MTNDEIRVDSRTVAGSPPTPRRTRTDDEDLHLHVTRTRVTRITLARTHEIRIMQGKHLHLLHRHHHRTTRPNRTHVTHTTHEITLRRLLDRGAQSLRPVPLTLHTIPTQRRTTEFYT